MAKSPTAITLDPEKHKGSFYSFTCEKFYTALTVIPIFFVVVGFSDELYFISM